MPMPVRNSCVAVDPGNTTALGQCCIVGAKAHRAAKIASCPALLQIVAAHPEEIPGGVAFVAGMSTLDLIYLGAANSALPRDSLPAIISKLQMMPLKITDLEQDYYSWTLNKYEARALNEELLSLE